MNDNGHLAHLAPPAASRGDLRPWRLAVFRVELAGTCLERLVSVGPEPGGERDPELDRLLGAVRSTLTEHLKEPIEAGSIPVDDRRRIAAAAWLTGRIHARRRETIASQANFVGDQSALLKSLLREEGDLRKLTVTLSAGGGLEPVESWLLHYTLARACRARMARVDELRAELKEPWLDHSRRAVADLERLLRTGRPGTLVGDLEGLAKVSEEPLQWHHKNEQGERPQRVKEELERHLERLAAYDRISPTLPRHESERALWRQRLAWALTR
jgi:hypothetical protein